MSNFLLGSADDYARKLREVGLVRDQVTFRSIFAGLASLENLKLLDVRKIQNIKGKLWGPLSMLRNLETLYIIVDRLTAEDFQPVSGLSES